MDLHSSTDIRN